MQPHAKTKKRVVVIGAGASGIGAARTLSAAGAEVIVLEGRDRIGGRMKKHCLTRNLTSSFQAGAETHVNIQLGANWIHGMESSNPMFEVAQKLGLELHQTSSDDDPGDDVILFDSGPRKVASLSDVDKIAAVAYGRVSKEDYHESLSRYEWIKEYIDHISVNYDQQDISLQAAFDLALQASESEIFGPCPEAQRRCLTWLYDRVSIDLGALSSKVSLTCYAEGVSDGAGGEGLVKHVGYSHVIHHLANEFPLDIRLNRCVSRVALHSTGEGPLSEHAGITVPDAALLETLRAQLEHCQVKDGRFVLVECSDGELFAADACVVTVPIGALQAEIIQFSPRPPSVITTVCGVLKPALMNLVWLWYPHAFWPEECNFLGIARASAECEADEDVKFTTFLIPPMFDNHGVRQAVLMCQIVGPYATTIESMSDADIAAEATVTLRAMFGAENVPDAIGCAHSTWGSDPFARGSWSYFPYRADSSSFDPGNGVPGVETVSAVFGDGAIVGSAREDQAGLLVSTSTAVVEAERASGADGSSRSIVSSVTVASTSTVAAAASVASQSVSAACPSTAATVTVTAEANMAISTAAGAVAATVETFSPTAAATARPRSVTISQAASSVLGGLPSPGRKYSDFGCTSDGSEDGSSSDDESHIGGEGGYAHLSPAAYAYDLSGAAGHCSDSGATTISCASSSDEPSPSKRTAGGLAGAVTGTSGRSLDEVISLHLYYASEAMSVQNRGTVHGAYKSGIREATKILAFLDDPRVK